MIRVALVVLVAGCQGSDDAPADAAAACGTTEGLSPFGLVVDHAGGAAYWMNGEGTLLTEPLTGGTPSRFAELGGYARGMASDGTSIFVAGGCEGHVWVVPLDGSGPQSRAMLGADGDGCVHGVAFDSTNLYVTNGGVWRVPLDGSPAFELVHPAQGEFGCNEQIAVGGGSLFWVNACDDTVNEMPIAGGGISIIDQGSMLDYSFEAVVVVNDLVVWGSDQALVTRPVSGGAISKFFGESRISGIAVDPSGGIAYAVSCPDTGTCNVVRQALVLEALPTVLGTATTAAAVALDGDSLYVGGGNPCPIDKLPIQ